MHRRCGFTLMEVMLTVVVIGIIAGLTLPRLLRRPPVTEWPNILSQLNDMIYFARQEAISDQTVYRLAFYRKERPPDRVVVESQQDNPEKPGTKIFTAVSSEYFETTYILPPEVRIEAVYLGKQEQLDENKGVGYCHVIHDGLVQDILLHMRRVVDGVEATGSFTVEPFMGTFTFEPGLTRPGQIR